MFEKFLSSNMDDFRQRYEGTYGFYRGEDGKKLLVTLSSIRDEVCTFSDAKGVQYKLNADAAKDIGFEFIPPKAGYYNTVDGVVLVSRIPSRQFQRGLSSKNTNISALTIGQFLPLRVGFEILEKVYLKAIPPREAHAAWNMRQAIAISKQIALEPNTKEVYLYANAIGTFERSNTTFMVKLQEPTLWRTEIMDAFKAMDCTVEISPGTVCSNPNLIVGIELEVEGTHHDPMKYADACGIVWRVERDGSLRPRDYSFEFISKPIPMEYALSELSRFYEKTKFKEDNYSDRCSVHVHTNVTDFTQEQLANLALVYIVVEDVLFEFVNFSNAKEKQGYCRDTNIYCIPWSQCRMNQQLVGKLFNNPVGAFKRWQKYTALNLLPILTQGTVEWRHMHGTADMKKLTTWFNLIGSIMAFAKNASFEDVVKTIKVLNDTSAYQQFFNSVLQGYIPYDNTYQPAMSDGVINAKSSLINWELNKDKPTKKSIYVLDDILDPEEDQAAPQTINWHVGAAFISNAPALANFIAPPQDAQGMVVEQANPAIRRGVVRGTANAQRRNNQGGF